MFTNYIYCGDCIDLCKHLDDQFVDLIISYPPYFKIKGDFDFTWETVDEYIEWCKLWILEFKRILKPTGSFYLWGAIEYNRCFALPKIANWIESNGVFTIKNWITQRNTRGYANCKSYMKSREELLFMVHNSSTTIYTWNTPYLEEKSNRKDLGSNNKLRKNSNKRCSDVWFDISEASPSSKQRFKTTDNVRFPTVKALKLCDRIGIWIAENETLKFWYTVLTDLKNRGVKDVFIFSVDGLPGFKEAINASCPQSVVQRCIIHQNLNMYRIRILRS